MRAESKSRLDRLRRAPMAAHVLGAFALVEASSAFAGTLWTVDSCSNGVISSGVHTGSLRDVLEQATDGDTIDMTGLQCSSITLTEPLTMNSGTITILGPGRDNLTISGNNSVRVFFHYDSAHPSNLVLEDLTLSNGKSAFNASTLGNGGCIYSTGTVTVQRVTITGCQSAGSGAAIRASVVTLDHSLLQLGIAHASGGGVSSYAATLHNSLVTSNFAYGSGGGIYGRNVSLYDSTVSSNSAGDTAPSIHGGGIFADGNLTIYRSTIDHNHVVGSQGGIAAYSKTPLTRTTTIRDSTISGNTATVSIGGIYVNTGVVEFDNSTIAFNSSPLDSSTVANGVVTSEQYGSLDLRFHSTLITNNFGGSTPLDFSLFTKLGNSASFTGESNFVRFPDAGSSGMFTYTGGCPRLGPLRDNGGPTRTHALLGNSPAIDHGDNVTGLPFDQRGTPFDRTVNSVVDIGAYEVQPEIIFGAGFDDC